MKELKRRLKEFRFQIATILIDTVYLIVWIFLNWLVNNKIKPWWNPEGFDLMMFNIFQFLGSFGTLFAIVFTFYVDLAAIYFRSLKTVNELKKKSKDN